MKKNIDSLDGLRAFACLLVVFGHFAKENIIFDIKGSGQLGVMLFFVLSGFLMAHLYAVQAITKPKLVEYCFRRCFRVLPAYVTMLLLSFALTPYWGNFPYAMDITGLVKHLKFQGDTSIFWTIPVEMKFYVFFPFLWLGLFFLRKLIFQSLFVFSLFVISINIFPFGDSGRLELSRYIEFFIGGTSMGLIHQHVAIKAAWQKMLINVLFVFSIVLIIIFIPQNFLKLTGIVHNMWNMPQILAPLFAACVLLAANITGIVQFIFANRIAKFLGSISFSLYLVHLPIIMWIKQTTFLFSAPALLKVMLALAMSILLAYVLYLSIEKPFRKLGAILNNFFQQKMV